ncbi:MAG: transketolase C-terminal domain-containing protein [Terrimicrobiaceae bacterium]
MQDLSCVPLEEIRRVMSCPAGPFDRARLFAEICRINTLYMIAYAGSGHIGSSFSSLDIVSWLFLEEMEKNTNGAYQDVYFSSKGHDAPGLYAALISLELLEFPLLHKLRRLGGLPGHPDIHTPYCHTNTGPLGMGISKAKGMLKARRLLGQPGRVFVLTGDGELEEGQFWESLVSAANDGLDALTVIVDHNKIQSDTWVKDVSDLGDLEGKFRAFGWETARCSGHDFAALQEALSKLKKTPGKPGILLADTLKGRGVSFMEQGPKDGLYAYHSGAPSPGDYERASRELQDRLASLVSEAGIPEIRYQTLRRPAASVLESPQKLVTAYSQALIEQARKNPRLVALDADLVLDCGLIPFRKEFPDRFVECGIAEQDMVSQAGGMALQGVLPLVHSFACFLSTRPNEQIYNNATEGTRIGYVGSLAGVLPSGPGHSHQCVRDIASLGGIPGLSLVEPCCEREVHLALDYCVNRLEGSFYLRLVSIPREIPYDLPPDYELTPGRGVVLIPGDEVVILGYGPVLLPEAWHAVHSLVHSRGKRAKLVNLPWLNRIDADWLQDTVGNARCVVTLDNHYISGGQGERIAAALAALRLPVKWIPLGLNAIPHCGQNAEVLSAHGLDAASMAVSISHAAGWEMVATT